MVDISLAPVESIYFCGCSRFSDEEVCPDHGYSNIATSGRNSGSYKRYTKKNCTVLRCIEPKTLISKLPDNYDYLNIDYTDVPVDAKVLGKILRKASADAFIQIEVEAESTGLHRTFEVLGLNFVGESIILSGKTEGFKQHRVLYFYHDNSIIARSKFNVSYYGSENFPDRFWLTKLERKRPVFLNVSTDKCWPVLQHFKGKHLFIQTPFLSTTKSLINPEYRKIFPVHGQAPNE